MRSRCASASVAEEHDVPIVENPPLARALYAAVELDEAIPAEHYKAVAQVIGYVMRLTGKIRRTDSPPPPRCVAHRKRGRNCE